MDPEDFEEDENIFVPKTLSSGSTIIVETIADTHILGVMVAPTTPGIILAQTHAEITPDIIDSLESLEDLANATPIETFLPFTSIHTIRSIEDLTNEELLSQFKDDIDSYGKESPPEDTEPPLTIWDRFIQILDRSLKSVGV